MATIDAMREFDRLAASLLTGRATLRSFPMDLYRQGEHYVLAADLPGVDPGSIDIDVDGRQLTIRAERSIASAEDIKWVNRERSEGSFVRQLTLGSAIDTEAISAQYTNGVLSVVMPIRESAKPRKIAISTSQSDSTPQQIEA